MLRLLLDYLKDKYKVGITIDFVVPFLYGKILNNKK